MARFGGHIGVTALLSGALCLPFGDDEISARLRAMSEAERRDPPEDSARAIRRRESRNITVKSQVTRRGRR